MEQFLGEIFTGTTLIAILAGYKICQILAKTIPDDAIGWLGFVRKVSKALSLYVPNKTSGP